MKRRLPEISSFETVLCLFVVMIHILSDSIEGYPKGSVLSGASFIFSRAITFAVPAFIISSAIKFAHIYAEGGFEYLTFLKRRITKIYIPYLIITVVYYAYFVFHLHYFDFDTGALFKHLTFGTVAAPFYFIIIIMQFYIIAPITLVFCKNITPAAGLVLSFLITVASRYFGADFQYSDRVFLGYFVYWIIGCYMGLNFDMNLNRLKRKRGCWIILGVLFTAVYSVVAYIEFLGWLNSFGTEILKILFAAFASVMWLLIMPEYQHEGADIVSPATFYIYLIHCLVIFETEHIMARQSITAVPLRFVILFFSTYNISITVSVLYSRLKLHLLQGLRIKRRL